MRQSESNIITYVRVLALFSIILCHYLQAYENRWAWVINVGVQIFFCISGYLYGSKEITHWDKWYYRRFTKLYIPFILFVSCVVLIMYSMGIPVGLRKILVHIFDLQGISGFNGLIHGIEHLWFMTAIMLCYLITPLLQFVARRYPQHLFFGLICVGILEYGFLHFRLSEFSWFYLFSMSYIYAHLDIKQKRITLLVLILLSCVFTVLMARPHKYIILRLWHDLVGLTIVSLAVNIAVFCRQLRLWRVVEKTSGLSYPLYIVHHVYLLGPLSILTPPDYDILTLSVLLVILSALTLQWVSGKIESLIAIH